MKDAIDTRRMSVETIERALEHHVTEGAIESWHRVDDPDRWAITLASPGPWRYVVAHDKREVGILLAGLISAEQATRILLAGLISAEQATRKMAELVAEAERGYDLDRIGPNGRHA